MKNSIKSITPDKKFFTNKGKSIRQLEQTNTISIYKNYSSHFFKKDDKISTLFEEPQLEELPSLANVIPTKRQVIINNFTTFTSNHKKASSSLMLSLIPLTLFIFFSIPAFTFSRPHAKYSVFSSKPLTVGGIAEQVATGDPRAVKLDGVFTEYGCPNFEGLGANFVAEADKNKIPYWLIPAVSFQESDCGNITPKKDGLESYNAYGWGIWGENVRNFDNWDHGIATVSKYMSDRFYSQGITDLCEIMKTYTPPSKGSWCKGVETFKDIIENYQTN